jgi:hypothetical protein
MTAYSASPSSPACRRLNEGWSGRSSDYRSEGISERHMPANALAATRFFQYSNRAAVHGAAPLLQVFYKGGLRQAWGFLS